MAQRIGIEASTWWNNRGFGRFTRSVVSALLARAGAGQSEFEYTLLVDREPDGSLPAGADVVSTKARKAITQAAVGAGRRSLGDGLSLARSVGKQRLDLLFYPAVYAYAPVAPTVKTVVTFHDTIAEQFPRLTFPRLQNYLLWQTKCTLARWQATRILTVSEASAEALHQHMGIPRERLDVTTEAADPVFQHHTDPEALRGVRARLGIPADAPLLVYAGGLNPHKNLLNLLAAMAQVLTVHPGARLVIVGDTSGKGFFDNVSELLRRAEDPALRGAVSFPGYLPDEELSLLLSAATAFVFPSYCEGFGLPVLEAMAAGAPVIVSARSSLPEVAGPAGVYFEPDWPGQMAACINRVLWDPDLRARMREAGLARHRSLTWDGSAALVEDCFRRTLGSAGAGRT